MKTGTLKELKVQDGDVVETKLCLLRDIKFHMGELWLCRQGENPFCPVSSSTQTYTLVSRAKSDLPHGHVKMKDGRVVDLTANTTPCDLMDPEELQAMKDHGGPWEWWRCRRWVGWGNPGWSGGSTYRVAPKPVVETVVLTGHKFNNEWYFDTHRKDVRHTHRITLKIKDGDIIDSKPEKL